MTGSTTKQTSWTTGSGKKSLIKRQYSWNGVIYTLWRDGRFDKTPDPEQKRLFNNRRLKRLPVFDELTNESSVIALTHTTLVWIQEAEEHLERTNSPGEPGTSEKDA